MKKLFAIFLMASVLALVALPVLATPVNPPDDKSLPATPPAKTGAELLTLIDTITNWFFAIFTVLTLIFILLAAFQFVTAGGDEAKLGEARAKLIWAAVGIIVALASKGLVPIIRSIVGG